ncbi:MAG: bifunctional diguanylate cyclase/phosphohydrolase [Candidatus Limnocylindrales bacterium]
MRLFGVLALAAPVALGILLIIDPTALVSWVGEGYRSIAAMIVATIIGVSLTALVVSAYLRFRFVSLVKAAERIAAGDYATSVTVKGAGLDARLARAVNDIAGALADTTDRATVDRLTGVANRQALLAELFAEVERASRYERPLSVAFVDIDHFKAVNDTYGHATGDVVLRGVAQVIAGNLRATDMIGRYGGEEFMLILTETNVDEGAILMEKLRTLVQRQAFKVEGYPDQYVTISVGIAGGIGTKLRMDTLVRDADAAMYSAKSLGRNQTYVFAEPDDDARVPRAPISAAGRARALEIGQRARDAATVALTSVLSPLPHYRGQPSALIASIVVSLAKQLQLPEPEIDRLRVAALLHDVGKVAVPEEILEKPSALTSAEWRTVVQHPRIGQVILEQAAALKDAVPIILHHHERYGGHGYPYGLRANEIPLGARIVAIADAYDAMVNDRPYKRAVTHEQAIAELRRHAGTQFDPELVELFCDLYATNAPVPDATIAALNATAMGHAHGAPLVVPETAARSNRRRRKSDEVAVAAVDVSVEATEAGRVSRTMAPDGRLGLATVRHEVAATPADVDIHTAALASATATDHPSPGRHESATG